MKLKDFLFFSDRFCKLCLDEELSSSFICPSCEEKLEYVDELIKIGDNSCHVIYFYNNFLREKFRQYKFEKKSYMARAFASLYIKYMRKKDILDFDYLISVPISKKRELFRAYNQVELIERWISKDLKIEMGNFLSKTFETKEQNKSSSLQRKINLSGSLDLKPSLKNGNRLKGKKLLVIDDFVTTGNTLLEINAILERKEPEKIDYLVLASGNIEKKAHDF